MPFARPDLHSMLRGLKYLRGLSDRFPVNGSFVPEGSDPPQAAVQPR